MKRLLILSGKGGTGKTSTAAAFIRFAGARAIADCDVDAPNLHLVISPQGEAEYADFIGGDKAHVDSIKCIGCGICRSHCRFDALTIENGRARVNEYACEGCGICRYVCPQNAVEMSADLAGRQALYRDGGKVFSTAMLKMGRGNSGKLVSNVKLAMIKNAPDTELAIIDGSPGIGCPVIASVSGMDLVLIVAEPSKSGFSDLERLAKTAKSFGTRLAVCVNRHDISPEMTESIRLFCADEGIDFVGCVPYDPAASRAINAGLSLADIDCPARDALRDIFNKLCNILELSIKE